MTRKFGFKDVLKYCIVKIILTSLFFVLTNEFNSEGNQQMIGYTILIGIASLVVLWIIILILNKIEFDLSKHYIILIIILFIVNEGLDTISGIEYNIYVIIMSEKPWQLVFKICDYISLFISGFLFFTLPVLRMQIEKSN